MMSLNVILLLFGAVLVVADIPNACPDGWTAYGGRCFRYYSTEKNWSEAESYCRQQGGHLAIIEDSGANSQVLKLTKVDNGKWTWFGLHDQGYEGTFQWIDGKTPVSYKNWSSGEPNNSGNEDCGEMESDGRWNDEACSEEHHFVCSRDQ